MKPDEQMCDRDAGSCFFFFCRPNKATLNGELALISGPYLLRTHHHHYNTSNHHCNLLARHYIPPWTLPAPRFSHGGPSVLRRPRLLLPRLPPTQPTKPGIATQDSPRLRAIAQQSSGGSTSPCTHSTKYIRIHICSIPLRLCLSMASLLPPRQTNHTPPPPCPFRAASAQLNTCPIQISRSHPFAPGRWLPRRTALD